METFVSAAQRAPAAPAAPSAAPDRRGVVTGTERVRLAAGFGAVLRAERLAAGLTQAALAARAGLARSTAERLERGAQRPSTGSTWRLARALRSDERARVALDLRLREAAGPSLREFSARARLRRDRIAAELLAEHIMPVAVEDDFGALVAAMLVTGGGI